jgi:hypothetical protein
VRSRGRVQEVKREPIVCFLIEEVAVVRRGLRRYTSDSCSGPVGYHNARRAHDEIAYPIGIIGIDAIVDRPQIPDELWPDRCDACGMSFPDDVFRQITTCRVYRRVDDGSLTTLRTAPPGAVWRAEWMEPRRSGADGKAYVVRLPEGTDWMLDGPSYDACGEEAGPGWVRSGEAPRFTVQPSILVHRTGYHARLENGVLVEV